MYVCLDVSYMAFLFRVSTGLRRPVVISAGSSRFRNRTHCYEFVAFVFAYLSRHMICNRSYFYYPGSM